MPTDSVLPLDVNSVPCPRRDPGPTRLLDYLYLGSSEDAANFGVLRENRITHLLNCASDTTGRQRSACSRFGGNTGVLAHEGFAADDNESYDILQHLTHAAEFINAAKDMDRKVLVYCAKGRNRSPAICVAYLMEEMNMTLDTATSHVANLRGSILTNPGFRKQLVDFSMKKDS